MTFKLFIYKISFGLLCRQTCGQCGGTGRYNSEVRARYGDPAFECDLCRGRGWVPPWD